MRASSVVFLRAIAGLLVSVAAMVTIATTSGAQDRSARIDWTQRQDSNHVAEARLLQAKLISVGCNLPAGADRESADGKWGAQSAGAFKDFLLKSGRRSATNIGEPARETVGEIEGWFADFLPQRAPGGTAAGQCALVRLLSVTARPSTALGVGRAYRQSTSGTGGTGRVTFTVSAGTLPAGTTLDAATGIVSGTPTTAGPFNYAITARDSGTPPQARTVNVSGTIAPAAVAELALTTTPSPNQRVDERYTQITTRSGGTGAVTFIVSAGALPPGTELDAATGTVAGTPTSPVSYSYTLQATDNSTPRQQKRTTLTGTIAPPVDGSRLDLNDVSILFKPPGEQGNLSTAPLIPITALVSKDEGAPVWSDLAFEAFSKLSGSPVGAVNAQMRIVLPPGPATTKSDWFVAGIRVDPGAPGLGKDVQRQFGRSPQIRLILQPITRNGSALKVHDVAAHLIYTYTSGFNPPPKPGCLPISLPDDEAFAAIVGDLMQLKNDLAAGRIAGKQILTTGDLDIHQGLADPVTAMAVKDRIKALLEKHLSADRLQAMAVMGLPGNQVEPWMFMAMQRLAPGTRRADLPPPAALAPMFAGVPDAEKRASDFLDLMLRTGFRAVVSPGLEGGSTTQMLSFEGSGEVLPAPSTNNENPATCAFNQPEAGGNLLPPGPANRKGSSTAVLFKSPDTATVRVNEIVDLIAHAEKSHFFNTDCVSCHTESQRALNLKSGQKFDHVAKARLPHSTWNVRNFGWFRNSIAASPDENAVFVALRQARVAELERAKPGATADEKSAFVQQASNELSGTGSGPAVATITRRTVAETIEVVDYVNCRYFSGAKKGLKRVHDGTPMTPGLCEDVVKPLVPLPKLALPTPPQPNKVIWLNQGWNNAERFWFHHIGQGTATFNIPYDWFVALEEPGPWGMPELSAKLKPLEKQLGGADNLRAFEQLLALDTPRPLLRDPEVMRRLGFIPSPPSLQISPLELEAVYGFLKEPVAKDTGLPRHAEGFVNRLLRAPSQNPDGLPIGFARAPGGVDPVKGETMPDQIGLTCAACHTGELTFKNAKNEKNETTSIRIDGASAMANLEKLQLALGSALVQTSKTPLRFARFARRVLGAQAFDEKNTLLLTDVLASRTLTPAQLKALEEAMTETAKRLKQNLEDKVAELTERKRLERTVLGARMEAARRQGKPLPQIAVLDHMEEGFGRLDALTRIGNQVFHQDLRVAETPLGFDVDRNFEPHRAPVSFPHIWTTPWHLWAQYDGSIMQPIIRNAGEALGVSARVNLSNKPDRRFSSTIDVRVMTDIEEHLAGPDPRRTTPHAFAGLTAPAWPGRIGNTAGPIDDPAWAVDSAAVDRGRRVYAEICVECHRPPVRDPGFTQENFWDQTKPWWASVAGSAKYIRLREFNPNARVNPADPSDQRILGTDDAMARILAERKVEVPNFLDIDPRKVLSNCGDMRIPDGRGGTVLFKDAPLVGRAPNDAVGSVLFSLGLMSLVDRTVAQWFRSSDLANDPAAQKKLLGDRVNCPNLPQAQQVPVYRARTLDGIWATAPFLHNGSVPSLWALLSPEPATERPAVFCVGSKEFDPVRVGLNLDATMVLADPTKDCPEGLTKLDTRIPGNSRMGHELRDLKPGDNPKGRIGRALKGSERDDLIAYLKTL